MLKLSIILGLLASIVWRTTPTNCRQQETPSPSLPSPTMLMSGDLNDNNTLNERSNQTAAALLLATTRSPSAAAWSRVNTEMADSVLRFMDPTVRPCDNFYQYACGRWYQAHIEQFDYADTLGLLDHKVNQRLDDLLRHNVPLVTAAGNLTEAAGTTTHDAGNVDPADAEETSTLYDAGGFFEKMLLYYRSCKKVQPYNLKKYLQQVSLTSAVDWFVLWRSGGRNWPAEQFDWLHAIAHLRQYGLNGVLLKEDVLPRWDDSRTNIIYLDRPSAADVQPLGQGVMIELLMDIGQTKRAANELAREVDGFEACLQRLHDVEDEEGPREMQVGYLREFLPEVDWHAYLQLVMGMDHVDLAHTVVIQNIPYMRALVRLVGGMERRIVCNYVMLRFLRHLQQRGPAEISRLECVASLRRAMPLAASFLVGQHIYGVRGEDAQRTQVAVRRLFEQLRQQFRRTLVANRLKLRGAVLSLLLQKIDAMRVRIGATSRNASAQFYDEYYAGVSLDSHNFYGNQLELLRWQVLQHHESLNSTMGASRRAAECGCDWEMYLWQNESSAEAEKTENHNGSGEDIERDPSILLGETALGSSSSPFYMKPYNMIVVPYGFLQLPVYSRHLWPLFQYAAFGFILAHELLHGFDAAGLAYDAVGNMMGPSDEIADNEEFVQSLRCMQNELATCSRSLNEKLADYEGLRLAYATFFRPRPRRQKNFTNISSDKEMMDNDDDEVAAEAREAAGMKRLLPQFSRRQLFFISYAQFFCNKEQRSVRELAHMEHALDEMRVFQTLANFEEFANEFQCERRDKMKLKSRCRLW